MNINNDDNLIIIIYCYEEDKVRFLANILVSRHGRSNYNYHHATQQRQKEKWYECLKKRVINAMARNIRTLLLGSKHTQRGTKFLIGGSHYEIYRSLQTEPKNVQNY